MPLRAVEAGPAFADEDEPQMSSRLLESTGDDRSVLDIKHATAVEQCRLVGKGMEEVTVRKDAYFHIEANDADGRRRDTGGDAFFVYIRGPSKIRARITDNSDGTYLVQWKPSTSGTYKIAVSLFGVHVPGSPATVTVATSMPCPTKSIVRGEYLHKAVSRQQHSFEVLFKDRVGQVAHAVDLDVFVEPLPPSSPRIRQPAKDAAASAAVAPTATKGKKESKAERERREEREREVRCAATRGNAQPCDAK